MIPFAKSAFLFVGAVPDPGFPVLLYRARPVVSAPVLVAVPAAGLVLD